jgi:hypothetical protein
LPSSLFDLGRAHLREQRQVVLDMPVVGDAAVRDLQQVGRDEIDRLTLALGLAEGPGEVAFEIYVDRSRSPRPSFEPRR